MKDFSVETYLIRNHKVVKDPDSVGFDRVEEVQIKCDFDLTDCTCNHFWGMKRLKRFKVLSKNSRFYTTEGVLFADISPDPNDDMREKEMFWDLPKDFHGKVLVAFPTDYPNRKYVVPEGINAIGKGAFDHTSIEELTLPDSIQYIGLDAFSYTKNLTVLRLPDNRHIVQINQQEMGGDNKVSFESNNGLPLSEGVLWLWRLCW